MTIVLRRRVLRRQDENYVRDGMIRAMAFSLTATGSDVRSPPEIPALPALLSETHPAAQDPDSTMRGQSDMNHSELFKNARGLLKQGESTKALHLLGQAIRHGQLDNERIEWAGRLIREQWLAGHPGVAHASKVLLLGQLTTSWLVPVLTAVAWGRGTPLLVSEGGYDTILQDVMTQSQAAGAPQIVALVPWNRRLLEGSGGVEERIEGELGFWRQVWSQIGGRMGARIVQVGYDWAVIPEPLGP